MCILSLEILFTLAHTLFIIEVNHSLGAPNTIIIFFILFRYPFTHNFYPLPALFRISPFLHHLPYCHTLHQCTQTLTLPNVNLTQSNLEQTHSNLTTSLYQIFSKFTTLSLSLSFSYIFAHIPFTPIQEISLSSSSLFQSNISFLKTSTTLPLLEISSALPPYLCIWESVQPPNTK